MRASCFQQRSTDVRVDVPTQESVQGLEQQAEQDYRDFCEGFGMEMKWTMKLLASTKEGIVTSGINAVVKVSISARLALNARWRRMQVPSPSKPGAQAWTTATAICTSACCDGCSKEGEAGAIIQ